MSNQPKLADADFVRLFEEKGAAELARYIGQSSRRIFARRAALEKKIGRQLTAPLQKTGGKPTRFHFENNQRINISLEDGVCLVGGDNHYWPGDPTLMHRAFVYFCKTMKPKVVVLNGDVLDLGQISRHPPIGWEIRPTVADEVITTQERLAEIEKAAFKAQKIWTLGNHDNRYETRLATHAQEFAGVHGVNRYDHFPLWQNCVRLDINKDVIIKHRGKGGKHDVYNTALHSGVTVVLGHSHCPYIRAITDARGTRWAVNHGMIADPDSLAFAFTEDSPYKDWRPSFSVLTFRGGRLLPPELVDQWDEDHVVFRGEVVRV